MVEAVPQEQAQNDTPADDGAPVVEPDVYE